MIRHGKVAHFVGMFVCQRRLLVRATWCRRLVLSRSFTSSQETQLCQNARSPYRQANATHAPKVSHLQISQREVLHPLEETQDRHELQSKLETLETIGCSQDQIVESPEILLLSEREILQRYNRLRRCGVQHINVMMLKLGHLKSDSALMERTAELQEATAGSDTIGASMAGKLQCNQMEWYRAKKKYVYLRHVRDMPLFNTKVDYLFSLGYSIQDIKQNIIVLNKSLACLQSRVSQASEANVMDKLSLRVLNFSQKAFSKWLVNTPDEKIALGGFADRFEMFAHLLKTTVDDVKEVSVLHKYRPRRIRAVMELLLEEGLKPDDILCHAHILLRNESSILKGLDKLREMGFSKPSVVQIVNVLSGRKVSKRQMKTKELRMLAKLLDVDPKDLEPQKPLLYNTLLRGKFALRQSIQYLQEKGFEGRDIVHCPILLGHDLSVLRSYVENYREHTDFKKFESQLNCDKKKILNWIQYLIEQDINFSSQEVIAEDHEEEDMESLEVHVV